MDSYTKELISSIEDEIKMVELGDQSSQEAIDSIKEWIQEYKEEMKD